jgi:hypothetical protein
VTDKAGNLLGGAVVQLENTTDLTVRSYITQTNGRYFFQGLNSEIDYTLKAHYMNCWSSQKTLSRLDSSIHRRIDLVVPVRELSGYRAIADYGWNGPDPNPAFSASR